MSNDRKEYMRPYFYIFSDINWLQRDQQLLLEPVDIGLDLIARIIDLNNLPRCQVIKIRKDDCFAHLRDMLSFTRLVQFWRKNGILDQSNPFQIGQHGLSIRCGHKDALLHFSYKIMRAHPFQELIRFLEVQVGGIGHLRLLHALAPALNKDLL